MSVHDGLDEELISYTKPSLPDLQTVERALGEIWSRQVVTNFGPVQAAFENALRPVLGGVNVLAVSNGWAALRVMLTSLDLTGDIIVSGFTHPATVQAAIASGLTPILADIDPLDLNVSVPSVLSRLTRRTCAILATHVFGNPADMHGLEELAAQHSVPLLFDAAAGAGVRYLGNAIGDYGTATAFSFHATKILSAIEAGALIIKDPAVADRARCLANFGIGSAEHADPRGMNAKANEITCAIGLEAVAQLDAEIKTRGRVRDLYREFLADVPQVSFIPIREGTHYNNCSVAVRVCTADGEPLAARLDHYLHQHNIESRRYFSGKYSVATRDADLPYVTAAQNEVICLPIWGAMTAAQVERVCDTIKHFAGSLAEQVTVKR